MNMPLNRDGTVDFSGTLFGLIRTALHIKRPEGRQINVLNVGARLPKTNLAFCCLCPTFFCYTLLSTFICSELREIGLECSCVGKLF